jgi:uncharacterized protein YgiM (DUF1202 family)
MNREIRGRHPAAFLSLAGILMLLMLFAGSAWAQPHGGPGGSPHHHPRYGEVFHGLPHGYHTVWAGRTKFFYHHGVFYRSGSRGFVVVHAPVGAVVAYLPIGFTTIVLGGIPYYYYDNVYYQRVPSGYIVAEPPPGAQVPVPPPGVEPYPAEAGQVAVTAELLNVRSGPGLDQPVFSQVVKGTVLVIQGSAEGWYYVQLPNGQFGWVMTKFTAPLSAPASG